MSLLGCHNPRTRTVERQDNPGQNIAPVLYGANMAEQQATTPMDVAAPEAPSSFDDKLAAKLGLTPEPAEAPAPETPEGELSADDLQSEEPTTPEGEWLELDRKGERRKVSKEEAKRLAQQGWDYSTNQEQLKAERAIVAQERAAVEAKAKITPLVVDAMGNVKFYEHALSQYNNFDWVAHAQADPLGYQATKAQFDQLQGKYAQARGYLDQALGAAQQVDTAINQAELQQHYSRILDVAPELRDRDRYKAETERMAKYLRDEGITEQEINSLSDSRLFLIARKAMRYDAAVKAKAEKQNGSPSLRPGPAPVRQSAQAREQEIVSKLHRAKDPAQKKALLDAALAAKLDRMA